MKKWLICLTLSTALTLPIHSVAATDTKTEATPYTLTQQKLESMTPTQALQRLKEGNIRFVNNKPMTRDLLQQAKETVSGQFPASVILSCMDSRGPAELVFDQGLGDVFSVRVAGNVIDPDQLGSMEYATKVVGTKLVVVMGHTHCGAVKGACQSVKLDNLTQLLDKIQPAVQEIKEASKGNLDCSNYDIIDKIAKQNVITMIKQVKEKSAIISDLVANKKVMIVGAMHDLRSGRVTFFDENGNTIN